VVNSLPLYLVPERLKRALGVAKHIFIQDGVSPNILLFCNEEVEVEFFKDASLIKEKEGLILMRSRDKERDRGKRKIFLSMSRYDLIDITMRLEQDGNCVYPFPSISFKPLVKEIKIPDVDWIVFTSKVGVNYFFKFLSDDIRKLGSMKIACVGKKTEEALNSFGIEADIWHLDVPVRGCPIFSMSTTYCGEKHRPCSIQHTEQEQHVPWTKQTCPCLYRMVFLDHSS